MKRELGLVASDIAALRKSARRVRAKEQRLAESEERCLADLLSGALERMRQAELVEQRRRELDKAPERWRLPFVHTRAAKGIFGGLDLTRTLGQFGVLVGAPGVGKSTALREYSTERRTSTRLLELAPSSGLKAGLEELLADAFDVTGRSGYRLHRAVRDQFARLGKDEPSGMALLIFDEAQFLSREAISSLRTLAERNQESPGCAMFFAGNESTLRGERRSRSGRLQDENTWHRELQTVECRVAVHQRLDSVLEEDVDAIALAVGIDAASDPEAVGLLLKVAELPGCLRLVEQLLRAAKVREQPPFTAEALKRVYEDPDGLRFAERYRLREEPPPSSAPSGAALLQEVAPDAKAERQSASSRRSA